VHADNIFFMTYQFCFNDEMVRCKAIGTVFQSRLTSLALRLIKVNEPGNSLILQVALLPHE
jgi:hypothetical protein